jgi:fatty-acyl-CoA synthase
MLVGGLGELRRRYEMEVSAWIAYWAGWTPQKTAVRFEGTTITYGELEDRIARTAGSLRAHDVLCGDRVAYLGSNCPELLELFFACGRIGAIFVPLNTRMPARELRVFLDLISPRLIFAEDELRAPALASAANTDSVMRFSAGGSELISGDAIRTDPEADPAATVLIAFTSGTTGTPKGAMHTNASIISNALDAGAALKIAPTDEVLALLPMFHVAGLNVLTVPALSIGGATVTVHRGFDAAMALGAIDHFGVSLMLATLPITISMAADPNWETTDLGSIRALLAGGAKVTEDWVHPWQERGVPVVQGYGMTEVGPAATLVPLADAPRKTYTAGKPTLHTRIRVVDPTGRDVAPGERGEIILRSPSMTPGYWRNPEATREAILDGWFHTGDIGCIDDEGFLHVLDRIKEIIIVGVSNVYPADIETVLKDSPDIADAAVVGLPQAELGEVPVAFVVRETGASLNETDVLSLCEGRLAPYKHPRHVLFVDALPRTPVGKVEKKTLRALAQYRCRKLSPANRWP